MPIDRRSLVLLGACAWLPALAQTNEDAAPAQPAPRPDNWAQPVLMPGVNNLHRITLNLYRSEQPSAEGMANLERIGIKTVINLRAFHTDREKLKGTKLLNPQLNVLTWRIQDKQVIAVLRLLRQADHGPFLIHCQHGADRTGLMSAMYRIVEQGWPKDEAIREMVEGGYGFHPLWRNIPDYIREVDVDKIKRALKAA